MFFQTLCVKKIRVFVEMEGPIPPVDAGQSHAPGVELKLCLILESRLRDLFGREKISRKKGKNRKLTKKDHDEIAQEVAILAFSPTEFARSCVERAMAGDFGVQHNSVPPQEAEDKAAKQGEDLAVSVAEKVVTE